MHCIITIRMIIVIVVIVNMIIVINIIIIIIINSGCYAMYCSPCAFYDMAEDMEPGTGVK